MTVGTRVVVRHRLAEPEPGGPHLTDVVGIVVETSDERVVVETSRGRVTVAGAAITRWKQVPPAPPRRTPRAVDG